MHNMFRAIRRIVEEYSNIRVIYPIHMNPAVRQIASEELGNCENIHIIEPLDVIDFHNFMKKVILFLLIVEEFKKKLRDWGNRY